MTNNIAEALKSAYNAITEFQTKQQLNQQSRLIAVSKTKPIATSLQKRALLWIWLFVVPLLYFVPLPLALCLLTTLILCFALLFFYYRSQLQGYTGDLLGAAQQVTELSLYLVWLIWWRQQ